MERIGTVLVPAIAAGGCSIRESPLSVKLRVETFEFSGELSSDVSCRLNGLTALRIRHRGLVNS